MHQQRGGPQYQTAAHLTAAESTYGATYQLPGAVVVVVVVCKRVRVRAQIRVRRAPREKFVSAGWKQPDRKICFRRQRVACTGPRPLDPTAARENFDTMALVRARKIQTVSFSCSANHSHLVRMILHLRSLICKLNWFTRANQAGMSKLVRRLCEAGAMANLAAPRMIFEPIRRDDCIILRRV